MGDGDGRCEMGMGDGGWGWGMEDGDGGWGMGMGDGGWGMGDGRWEMGDAKLEVGESERKRRGEERMGVGRGERAEGHWNSLKDIPTRCITQFAGQLHRIYCKARTDKVMVAVVKVSGSPMARMVPSAA